MHNPQDSKSCLHVWPPPSPSRWMSRRKHPRRMWASSHRSPRHTPLASALACTSTGLSPDFADDASHPLCVLKALLRATQAEDWKLMAKRQRWYGSFSIAVTLQPTGGWCLMDGSSCHTGGCQARPTSCWLAAGTMPSCPVLRYALLCVPAGFVNRASAGQRWAVRVMPKAVLREPAFWIEGFGGSAVK